VRFGDNLSSCCGFWSFLFESRIDGLVVLVHVGSEFGSAFWLMESERNGFCNAMTFPFAFEILLELLLESFEVRHWLCHWRLERKQEVLTLIELFFLLSEFLSVGVFLHPWRQACLLVAEFSILLDSLNSVVFLFVHFPFVSGNSYLPADNLRSERRISHDLRDIL